MTTSNASSGKSERPDVPRERMPDDKYVADGSQHITKEHLEEVLDKEEHIESKLVGPLEKFVEDVQLLFCVLKDYWTGKYREIPFRSIATIVFALLYVLAPVDLIPDFIPVIGLVDDAAVVAICLKFVHEDLQEYKKWKDKEMSSA